MSELMKKIMKNSKNPYIDTLMESELLSRENLISTDVPALNIALSGDVYGGFGSGVITIAGKSKHFKTLFALEMTKAYLQANEDAVLVFFDSEFGSPREYFKSFGEASKRIIHVPVTTVEEFRTEMMNQLEGLTRGDKVVFMLDSIGNLASMKEFDDSLSGKQTVDMTRAKVVKSIFRLITARLKLKDLTLFTINHTYQTLEMFSKEVMGGGTGTIFASDTIIFMGKQQEKDGKELLGYNFVLNIEKSRFVKEKEKISVLVTYNKGIDKFSGMFDLAVEFGIIDSPSQGYYTLPNDDKKLRRKVIEGDDKVMRSIIDDEEFQKMVAKKYKLSESGNQVVELEAEEE